MLQRTVRATIEKHGMFAGGDRVVVAVSGGPDSVALLHVLNSLKPVYRIHLHAAHLDHGLRGEESRADAQFVASFCSDLAIPLTTKAAEVAGIASTGGLSLEAAARKVRYAFLDEVLQATSSNKAATGHNANDQAETVLVNLLRGSGMAGFCGIRPALEGKVVRPLIEARREEIIAYLRDKSIPFRVDSSNLDDRFERNKVRRVLIPLVEKEFNPGIVDSLVRTASVFAEVWSYVEARVEEVLKSCTRSEEGRTSIDLEAFAGVPRILRLFTLYRIVRSFEGDEQVATFDALNAVANLIQRSRSGSRIDIGSGIVAVKEFDRLVMGRDLAPADAYEVQLSVPGSTSLEEAGFTVDVGVMSEPPESSEIYRSGETAYFDFDKIDLPLVARNWREGDKFVPFGLSGSKKVHDIFVDEKVPVSERSRIPIIADREDILWVAGVRRAERARITAETRKLVRITCKKDVK